MDLTKQPASTIEARTELLTSHVLALRIRGLSYRKMATQLGCSPTTAHRLTVEHLREIRTLNEELVEELRTLELARLDDMWRRIYPENFEERIGEKQALALLRIVQQRRAIAGLDVQPKNAEIGGDVPYAGAVDMDLLTVEQLREFEVILMRATGLDPAMEVQPPAQPQAKQPSAVRMEEPIAESHNSTLFDIQAIDVDPDTGYPLAVALSAPRSSSYLPE